MGRIKTISRTELREKNRAAGKKIIAGSLIYIFLIVIFAVIQTSGLKIFGSSSAFVLALVCSSGFVFGEKAGAFAGLFGGFVCDCLGIAGISLLPLFYMVSGYMCGVMIKWFLSQNLPSFIIYSLIIGGFREGITLLYYIIYSDSFNLFKIIGKVLLPEYFAFVLISPLMYIMSVSVKKFLLRNRK